jgi:hypothetical protein
MYSSRPGGFARFILKKFRVDQIVSFYVSASDLSFCFVFKTGFRPKMKRKIIHSAARNIGRIH